MNEIEDVVKQLFANKADDSISAHYGFKSRRLNEMVGDILRDIMHMEKRTDVIDEHFPSLNAESRLKVFALHIAFNMVDKSNER